MNDFKLSLECPLPQTDFDVITLGHGSGGLLTNKLLDQQIFGLFDNPELNKRHDGVILPTNGEIAFTTDSFVVNPIFFPGGNIGDLAVNGTVNDLAMCGAIPKYLSLGLILEEGLELKVLWEILLTIKKAADEAGVQIVTGDTKVVEKGKGDRIFINTTGVGIANPKAKIGVENILPTDRVVISNEIASHGMTILSKRDGLQFDGPLKSDCRPLHNHISGLIERFGDKIHLVRDATRGGVATVLNEIASQSGLGVELQQDKIPVNDTVSAACEFLGLDPLYVANEGAFVGFFDESIAEEAVSWLRSQKGSEHAVEVGRVNVDHRKKVVMKSTMGGSRVVGMLAGEQLPRIC